MLPEKQESLRQARLPVIEVPVPKILEYPFEDDQTTDPREAFHVRMIQNMLQKGFLAEHVISDPRSVDYLEKEVGRLEQELQQSGQRWAAAKRRGDEASQQLKTMTERAASVQQTFDALTRQKEQAATIANEAMVKLAAEVEKSSALSKSLGEANETIGAQRRDIRFTFWMLCGVVTLVAFLCAYLLYQSFFASANDQATQTGAATVPQQAAPASVPASNSTKMLTPTEN